MAIRICLGGVTGNVGRALLPAIIEDPEFELTGAVSRRAAGEAIGGINVSATLEQALAAAPADVLIDYTAPDAALAHIETALVAGVSVVLGTTGLSAAQFEIIDIRAKELGVGVVTGNFSLTAALLQHFALFAARHLDCWEVIDACKADKPDAPSGTARELAERLAAVKKPNQGVAVADVHGLPEARGADVDGVQCHSLRLPGYASSVEVIFGLEGERLSLRHEAISQGAPFVAGSLLAARKIGMISGVVRGLDSLLFADRAL